MIRDFSLRLSRYISLSTNWRSSWRLEFWIKRWKFKLIHQRFLHKKRFVWIRRIISRCVTSELIYEERKIDFFWSSRVRVLWSFSWYVQWRRERFDNEYFCLRELLLIDEREFFIEIKIKKLNIFRISSLLLTIIFRWSCDCSEIWRIVCDIAATTTARFAIIVTFNIFCKVVLIMRFILEIFSFAVFFRVSLIFSFNCDDWDAENLSREIVDCDFCALSEMLVLDEFWNIWEYFNVCFWKIFL